MNGRRVGRGILLWAATAFLACSTPQQAFMHKVHREAWAIDEPELRDLVFFISTDVLVRALGPDGERTGAEGVVLLRKGTPGSVVEVGPDWLRVSFQEGGTGAVFLGTARPGSDSFYWLATEVEGEPGYHKLKDLPHRVLILEERRYEVMHGTHAHLRVRARDLEELIGRRTQLEGRE